jgi:protein-S-isoprenylcysteine O-methyltransferase Ste14
MKRTFSLLYALGGYLLGMATIAYLIGFLADFGVPKAVNTGAQGGALWLSALIDAALVLGFGLHHSLTARRGFKAWWTKIVPAHLERATYLYMTAAAMAALVLMWRPIPNTLWRVEAPGATVAIVAAYLAVWGMMFAATFHFGHFGFFGLRQAWDALRARTADAPSFSARYLYALARHPISLGWMLTPWLTPHLTVGQLVFALSATAYVLAATPFEEADLIAEFGERYRRYRREVPAFLPRLVRAAPSERT